MMSNDNRPTVWSSQQGDMRKKNDRKAPQTSLPPHQQMITLHRESKGRAGKTVTIIKNLTLSEKDIKELTKQLKQACGSGGTIKDDVIEIQGEHRNKISEYLEKQGYKVKISGG